MIRLPKNRPRTSHGMTLIEMMIVVSVIGILAMILVPSMRRRMAYYRVADAADRLYMELRLARGQAISGTRHVSVAINTNLNELTSTSDLDDNGSIDTGESAVLTFASAETITVECNSENGEFLGDGTFECSNSYWRVHMTVRGASDKYVYVFPGGHVEVSEGSLE